MAGTLGLREAIVQAVLSHSKIEEDELGSVHLKGGEILSRTDQAILNLARALTFNPEVLVAINPTVLFSRKLRARVLRALRAFVDARPSPADPTPCVEP